MSSSSLPSNANVGAPNTPYFTPIQNPPAGTAFDPQPDGKSIPKLFQPLRIRGVEFQNRIWLSPLCQYSAKNGIPTPWHMAHLGGIFTRGPGHSMIEATAVLPNGRITPEDLGIWSDAHIAPLKEITTFAHSQSQKIGIQLAHAGRKASNVAPWISGSPTASKEVGGWPDDVVAPSAIPYDTVGHPMPRALTVEEIKGIVKAFVDAAKRSVEAGFDVIEIHAAHGYLLSEFLSPLSNKRTDDYGGSFENRIRIVLEIADGIRSVIPESMPLFVRVSGTDWVEDTLPNEPSWRVMDTARLAPILYAHGVDLIDISSGGVSPKQKIGGPVPEDTNEKMQAYQAPLAKITMKAIGAEGAYPSSKVAPTTANKRPERIIVATVGNITSGKQAEELLDEGYADVIMVGRHFTKDPGAVWSFADELDVKIRVASQIGWGFVGRGKKITQAKELDGN